jgi:hypothetical protein
MQDQMLGCFLLLTAKGANGVARPLPLAEIISGEELGLDQQPREEFVLPFRFSLPDV